MGAPSRAVEEDALPNTECDKENTKCPRKRSLAAGRDKKIKRRKKVTVMPWSQDEKDKVADYFASYIARGKLPGLCEIRDYLLETQSARKVQSVKDHLRNTYCKK